MFGAFLILPALLALQMVVAGRLAQAAKGMGLLALLTVAILLSFSRAAWGQLAFTGRCVARVDVPHDAVGQPAAADRPDCDGRRCLLGVLWGLIAATRAFEARNRLARRPQPRPAGGLARPTSAS